jgi:hypothetical protein
VRFCHSYGHNKQRLPVREVGMNIYENFFSVPDLDFLGYYSGWSWTFHRLKFTTKLWDITRQSSLINLL